MARGGRAAEPAAGERDEIGVGEGQRDHATAARDHAELVQPAAGRVRARARDARRRRDRARRSRRASPTRSRRDRGRSRGRSPPARVSSAAPPARSRRPGRRAARSGRTRRRASRRRAGCAAPGRWRAGAAARLIGYSIENGTPAGVVVVPTRLLVPSGGSDCTGSSIRTAATRARGAPAGAPFTLTRISCTPVCASARPSVGSPRSGTDRRTGIVAPGASESAIGWNWGVAASVAALPSSASRSAPSVVSGLLRCTRATSCSTGSVAGVDEGADDREGVRAARRDDAAASCR